MHRLVRDMLAQGGDLMVSRNVRLKNNMPDLFACDTSSYVGFQNRQGEYSLSVYGGYFADENFVFRVSPIQIHPQTLAGALEGACISIEN